MGRSSICPKTGLKSGAWTPEEDGLLSAYITKYGPWNWREIPKFAGLSRYGKSCRLRWMNYLRPNIKRGNYTREEEELIINLHGKFGSRWSAIAMNLPGRTDNEIKNYWHTHLIKKSAKPNTTSKETTCKPAVGCETLKRKESVPSSFHSGTLRPIILESSTLMLPVSPEKSVNLSPSTSISKVVNHQMIDSSSTSSETLTEFDGKFWTDPFIADDDDLYRPENTTSDCWTDPSHLYAIAGNPYDLYDGYDMDSFFNY